MISEMTGSDLFQIVSVHAYLGNYNEYISEAQNDQRRDARPDLREYSDSLDAYDTIYFGYPNMEQGFGVVVAGL